MYFFQRLRFEKGGEFTRLIQENMIVAQYVAANSIKVSRFEKGLKLRIRVRVRLMQLVSYREVVNLAKIVEQKNDNIQ